MIHSCKDCIAPKRYPGCHAVCPEYLAAKAEHERRKAEYYKDDKIGIAIYQERTKKVHNALKSYRGTKYMEK